MYTSIEYVEPQNVQSVTIPHYLFILFIFAEGSVV